MKMKKMTGINDVAFSAIFNSQMHNQMLIFEKGLYEHFEEKPASLPMDSVGLSSYHVTQLISEVGEILDADKRWKSFRNTAYDKHAKVEEIADCFLELINIAMFSGLDSEDLVEALVNKINVVNERIMQEK